jgi:hypothetical protein
MLRITNNYNFEPIDQNGDEREKPTSPIWAYARLPKRWKWSAARVFIGVSAWSACSAIFRVRVITGFPEHEQTKASGEYLLRD